MKGITILGSTGTIGVSTLEVIALHSDRFQIVALTAHRDVDAMLKQCQNFKPQYAVMADADAAQNLAEKLKRISSHIQVLSGIEGLCEVAALDQVDTVMAAIVGAAGLMPTLSAAKAGKRILLANKEALVMSGDILMREAETSGARILPIDSEHNAIFQCLPDDYQRGLEHDGVSKILLTSSGGPFLHASHDMLVSVTPAQAVAHPNWVMGRKISVDSATMMNKGLEVIEATILFGVDVAMVDVVIHPQSIIHSMVSYIDGSYLAQLASPDMKVPIAHALAWPQRMQSGVQDLDFFAMSKLEFYAPDLERFPCLQYAYQAADYGETMPAILNAANEVAVAHFLEENISFLDIPRVISAAMENLVPVAASSVEAIVNMDQDARMFSEDYVGKVMREQSVSQ